MRETCPEAQEDGLQREHPRRLWSRGFKAQDAELRIAVDPAETKLADAACLRVQSNAQAGHIIRLWWTFGRVLDHGIYINSE